MTAPRRSSRRPLVAALAAAASLALVLTGCAGGGASAAGGDAPAGDPVDGGDLVIAIGNDPQNFNPSGNGSGNDTWYVTRQLVDSLTYQNPETNEFEPWLAESWEINDDATRFTFHLRDGVTFSDGTPLTANEVKGTFDDIVAAGAQANAAGYLVGYEATNVVDERTAEVVFSSPNAAFLSATSTVGLGIVAASTVAVPYGDRADGQAVVGTGPFTLGSYTKDVSTELLARDDYAWAPAALGNAGAAHLDSVTFQVVPEAGNRTGTLASGQVDVAGGIQPIDVATLEGSGLPIVSRGNPGLLFGTVFNVSRPALADPVVREALSAATNAEEIRDTAVNERFAIGTSALSSTTPGWADQSAHYGFDAAKATSLLDGAGWVAGADGIRVKNGERLTLKLAWIQNFGPNQTALEVLQQQWRAAGVELELVGGPVPEFLELQQSGDFDVAWINFSRGDADVLRTQFSAAGTNYYRIQDAELESLFTQQLAQPAEADRTATFAQIQERLATQHYVTPVFELTTIIGTSDRVHGLQLGADSRLDTLVAAWIAA